MQCMTQPGNWSSGGSIALLFIIARSSIFSAPYLGGPACITSRRASGYCVTNPTASNRTACSCKRNTAQAPNQTQVRHCCRKLGVNHHSSVMPRWLAPQGGSTPSWAVFPSSSCKIKANLGFKAARVPGARSWPQAPPCHPAAHCSPGLALAGDHRGQCSLLAPLTASSGSLALCLSTTKVHQASSFVKWGCISLFGKYFGAGSGDSYKC